MKHWDKYDLGGVFDVFDFDKKMALINLDMIYEYAVKLDNIVSEESQLEDWVKMKLTRIEQNVSDVAHSLEGWEKFDEGGMIFKKQLLSISKYAHKLIEMIKGGSKLMSWQENKLAVSANDIDNLYHHLDYKVGNRASQNKFATGGMMKYPDLSNETPIVINEPNNQKISEIDIALIDIALVRKDLGIEKTKIGSSDDAYRIFKQLWNKESINVREEMNVLFLNNANEPIGYYEHTKGAINSTLVDVEMIAALALKTLSKGVILAHNHPSGNNKPSEADIKLYQQVKTALKMFNVTVLDSMILVPNSDNYYSLADNGYEMGGSLSFERGGSVYRIVEGYDHYKGIPLYQVIGDNDYVGEYHTDREDAEKELQELIGGVGEFKKGDKVTDGRGNVGYIKQIQANGNLYIQWISYSGEPTRDMTADNDPNDFEKLEYKNGGVIKTDFNELENTKLRNVLISFWNDFFNSNIYNYLSIEKENYILSNIDNVFVIVRDKDKGNFSYVEKEKIDSFLSPYFDSGKKPLFSEFFDRYEIKDNKIIIYMKAEKMYAKGGGVGKYKVGDKFIGTPNAKYDESWQLFKPSTSYVIDNKTNKIISIHNTPYEAIKKRDSMNPNFILHFKVYPKEHYKETGGGVGSYNLDDEINKLYEKSGFINTDFNWKLKLLEMLQDQSIEAYNIYQKLSKEQKGDVLQQQFEIDNDMGSDGDGNIETSKENLQILLEDAKNGKKYSKGGNINLGRDALFKSQEPHEQRYKRKREWKEYKKEGWFGDWYKGGGAIGEIDMDDIEKQANFYTDESRWATKPTVEKFDKEIMEYQDLKLQLDNNEIRPSKIIGTGFKPQYARALAYKWINERILVAKIAIEILIEKQKQSKEGDISNLQKKIDYINKNYDGVTASKTYSDNRIQVVSPYFNTLNEIKRKEFGGSGLMERYGNTSSYVLYSNQNYEMGGNVSSELSEPQKEFSKSAEMLVRENLQNGEICMCKLRKILGHEPNYPKQVVGSLVLEKAYLRNFYKI